VAECQSERAAAAISRARANRRRRPAMRSRTKRTLLTLGSPSQEADTLVVRRCASKRFLFGEKLRPGYLGKVHPVLDRRSQLLVYNQRKRKDMWRALLSPTVRRFCFAVIASAKWASLYSPRLRI